MNPRRRVVFCTYPSLYSDLVLHELLKSPQIEVVGVVVSTRILRKDYSKWRASVRQIQLSGLRYAAYLFAVTDLYRLLQTLLGKQTLFGVCRAKHIPVLETADINEPATVTFLKVAQPDVMLSAHFNQLLAAEVLAVPGLACLNIHPSLLPAFKGVDPAFYALLRHAQETGVTVHLQDEQFDHGRILEQARLQVRWHDSLLSLNVKLFKLGAMAAVRQIGALASSTLGQEQPPGGGYDSWPNPHDTRQFRRQRRYLRWREYAALARGSMSPAREDSGK